MATALEHRLANLKMLIAAGADVNCRLPITVRQPQFRQLYSVGLREPMYYWKQGPTSDRTQPEKTILRTW